ncbi:MAG: gliding motility lipoprotein GldB [Flavobacteriaceae bacterium]
MRNLLSLLIVMLLFFQACKNDSKIEKEISKIDINVHTERFEKLFTEASPSDLPQLKTDYPFMFSSRYHDSIWINRMQDTLQQEMFSEIQKQYADFADIDEEIKSLFQHLKYYYPTFKTPRVITLINDVQYRSKTIVTDSIALIAIDNYLGKDHMFYGNIQQYIRQNFEANQIVSDLATEYAQKQIYQPARKSLIDEMVYFGKLLYFKDVMIPFKTDAEKIGYTQEELDWAIENEPNIWQFFVEKELLFETNPKLASRFINPAPFTKFNLELDAESPGRLGQYIGWQIVKAYMENNDTDFKDMLQMDATELFNKSKFKPRK